MPTWANSDISQDTRDVQHEWDGWHWCSGPRLHPATEIVVAFLVGYVAGRLEAPSAPEALIVPDQVEQAARDRAAGKLDYLTAFAPTEWCYDANDVVYVRLYSKRFRVGSNEHTLVLRWTPNGWRISPSETIHGEKLKRASSRELTEDERVKHFQGIRQRRTAERQHKAWLKAQATAPIVTTHIERDGVVSDLAAWAPDSWIAEQVRLLERDAKNGTAEFVQARNLKAAEAAP